MLFKDGELQESFDSNGYVFLDDFLADDDVARLRELLQDFHKHTEAHLKGTSGTINSIEKGKFFTRHFENLELEKNMRAEMADIAYYALQKFLNASYKTIAALGIYKPPCSPNSVIDLHVHHSNLAPGSKLPGLSMFVPLDDLDDALGPLALINGSHKLWENDLSYTLTHMDEAYPALYPLMENYLTTLSPRAGQAIVFDQFTIHKGWPNIHQTAGRLAVTAEFIPEEEQCVLFLPKFDGEGKIISLHGTEVLKLPLEFGTKHRWIPEHLGDEVLTLDPYQVSPISRDKFESCCFV